MDVKVMFRTWRNGDKRENYPQKRDGRVEFEMRMVSSKVHSSAFI